MLCACKQKNEESRSCSHPLFGNVVRFGTPDDLGMPSIDVLPHKVSQFAAWFLFLFMCVSVGFNIQPIHISWVIPFFVLVCFSHFGAHSFDSFYPMTWGKQHLRIASTKVLHTSICCDWSSAIWAQALCQSCLSETPSRDNVHVLCSSKRWWWGRWSKDVSRVGREGNAGRRWETRVGILYSGSASQTSFHIRSRSGFWVRHGTCCGWSDACLRMVGVFFLMWVGQKLSKWMLGGPLRTYKTKTPRTMSQRIPVHIVCFLWDMYVKKTSFEKMCLSLSPFILPYPVTLRKKGAVDDFNQLNPLHTIQPYDMLLQLDEAKGSKAILDQLAAKNMPENVQLTVLRPKRTRISLRTQGSMALGIKLVLKEMFPGWWVTVWFCCCCCCCWWLDSLYLCFFKMIKGDLKSWSCWSNLSIVQHFLACLHIELYYDM